MKFDRFRQFLLFFFRSIEDVLSHSSRVSFNFHGNRSFNHKIPLNCFALCVLCRSFPKKLLPWRMFFEWNSVASALKPSSKQWERGGEEKTGEFTCLWELKRFSHVGELIERSATAPLWKREWGTKSNLHVHDTATISVFYGLQSIARIYLLPHYVTPNL